MSVIIDQNAGFCFGVVKAIAAAEQQLAATGHLYCLGDIVHNNEEVRRLANLGLQVIDKLQFANLSNATVLIRAHGEPPETYRLAAARNITLIDATCPIVLALQKKVREGFEAMKAVGGQIVIFGKKGHAEVIGLNGQTDNSAIIVSSPDDIHAIDFSRPLQLYSQTTMSRQEYDRLIELIQSRLPSSNARFAAHATICSRVANRATQLEAFAQSVDLLLFVSGVNSSNGHYLFEYCRKVQPKTYMISSPEQINPCWLDGAANIGITGATSTPRWLMEEIKNKLSIINND